jgi:hypothetical protein
MKKILKLTLFLSALFILSGCSSSKNAQGTSTTTQSTKTQQTTNESSSKTTAEVTTTTQQATSESTTQSNQIPETSEDLIPQTCGGNLSIDLEQIAQNDFSSLNGTWKNKLGQTITIENGTITASELGEQQGQLTNSHISHQVGWIETGFISLNPLILIVAPENISPENIAQDVTDTTRNRIFLGSNGGVDLFSSEAQMAFYRD